MNPLDILLAVLAAAVCILLVASAFLPEDPDQ